MIRCLIISLRFFLGIYKRYFISFLFAGIRIVGPRWSVPPPTSTTSHTWVLEMASRFRDSWIFPLLWRPQIRWDETCCDTWHSLSPCPRLVTAATARVLWPGLSQSRESSPCLVRARASCPRPACPPIPRLRSAPSATQRSVASEHTAHMIMDPHSDLPHLSQDFPSQQMSESSMSGSSLSLGSLGLSSSLQERLEADL